MLSRRSFLKATTGISITTFASLSTGCRQSAEAPEPGPVRARRAGRYDGLDTSAYLGEARTETRIEGDAVFTEGPAVDRVGNVYFTNIRASQILRWDPIAGQLDVFREETNEANGLRFDPQGRLLICEGSTGRLVRLNVQSGETEVLLDSYEGLPLQAINDVAIDRAGRIYVTSRHGRATQPGDAPKAVYRVDPDGTVARLLIEPDVHMPNGIVVSPDERTLYLIEADGGEARNRHIRAYDLLTNGSIANRRDIYDFYPGRSGDGMAVDEMGNLYVAAGLHRRRGSSETLDTKPGIHVFSPSGRLLAYAETPEDTVTNCTFGGPDLKTLYVTCGSLLLSLQTVIPGKSSYRPEV